MTEIQYSLIKNSKKMSKDYRDNKMKFLIATKKW